MLSLNQVHPAFRDVRARRAILAAMSQDDFMHALTADDKMWKPMPSFFTPGTPLYTEEGSEILKAPRKLDTEAQGLSEERERHRPRSPLVLLGRQQNGMKPATIPSC
jgi:peptide/nickel transport system substrate-binding protein